MAQIRLTQGDHDVAAKALQEALKLEPANATAFRELGNVYANSREDKEAEETFRKAIEMRPGDAAGHTQLGIFYFNRRRLPEAELSFRRVIELTPDSHLAHSNLGAVYLVMGRYAEAAEQSEKSVAIEPNTRGYSNLGTSYYRLRRYGDAALAFQRAVELAPTNAAYRGYLADAYRWTPELRDQAPAAYRRAIELVQQEIKINPQDPELHARLAMYFSASGDRPQALAEVDAALKLDPASASVLFDAALVQEDLHNRDAALKAIEALLNTGQKKAEILASPVLEQLRKDPRFARMAGPRP